MENLTQKDRIGILLSEYQGLRSEITSRTGFGFQLLAVGAAGIVWLSQQPADLIRFGIGIVFFTTAIGIFSRENVKSIWRTGRRIRELEHEINSRAGEHLLIWEHLQGPENLANRLFGKVKSSSRSSLPPLDPSYLQPNSK